MVKKRYHLWIHPIGKLHSQEQATKAAGEAAEILAEQKASETWVMLEDGWVGSDG